VAAFKHAPGNANLPIGASKDAIHENGVPRNAATGAAKAVWHSRGYLPHFESAEATQHVTFHLADSLPQTVLLRWKAELAGLPTEKRDVEQRKRVDAWIDAGHGSCVLRSPPIAAMVQESLLTFDAQRYRLLAWVVMPNHVHVLFQPIPHWTVAKIVASRVRALLGARVIVEEVHGSQDLRRPAGQWQGLCGPCLAPGVLGSVYPRSGPPRASGCVYPRKSGKARLGCRS
jgi:hypothetical protein